jgi:LysR family carnitine catabolism transcriptional activator
MNARGAVRPLNLSLRHLRAVRDVAAHGSFTAAALNLAMTQPGVSRLVAQVERDLGVPLFLRSTRSVVLTGPGRELAEAVGRFLDDLDAQVAHARGIGGQVRGRLVISCLLSLTHHLVPDALAAYRREHPGVEIHMREGLGSEVYEDVRSGIADFGLGNATGLGPEIVAEDVVREACLVVLPAGHRLAARPAVTLAELAEEPLVSLPLGSGLRRLIDGTAAAQGITLSHMTVVEQFGSLFDFVAAGLGLAIAPPTALPPRLPRTLQARPIVSPAIVREIGILRLRARPLPPAAQGFLGMFRPRFAQSGKARRRGGAAARA